MKCTKHKNHFIERIFLLFVCHDFHRFAIQLLVKCQYRIMTIFSSQVWFKRHDQVNTRIITGWHISHWLKMYFGLTWTRTIMRCFHKTIPSHAYCHRLPRTFVLPRATSQRISLNIFSGLISHKKLKKFVSSFDISTISLPSIIALSIAYD